MTKIVIPKGMVIFPGETQGVATENIHVSFDGSPDEVAAVLCQNDQKDLLPLLEHEDDGKLVRYTRQGNRIETPIPVKNTPKPPSVQIPPEEATEKEPASETDIVAGETKAAEENPADENEAALISDETKTEKTETEIDAPKNTEIAEKTEIIETPVSVKDAPKIAKNNAKSAARKARKL